MRLDYTKDELLTIVGVYVDPTVEDTISKDWETVVFEDILDWDLEEGWMDWKYVIQHKDTKRYFQFNVRYNSYEGFEDPSELLECRPAANIGNQKVYYSTNMQEEDPELLNGFSEEVLMNLLDEGEDDNWKFVNSKVACTYLGGRENPYVDREIVLCSKHTSRTYEVLTRYTDEAGLEKVSNLTEVFPHPSIEYLKIDEIEQIL